MSPTTTTDRTAMSYIERGWAIIQVPYKSKSPIEKGWQTQVITKSNCDLHFPAGKPTNYGVLLGAPSGNLTDLDLDCAEAVALAPAFLPQTDSRFGRASKPASHWLYSVQDSVETEKFADPDGGCLLEIRSTGAQTVAPGSTHPEGEAVRWDKDGEQAKGDGKSLRKAAAELAATCLLARHWPDVGSRHDAALAAAGLLARGGLDGDLVFKIIDQIAQKIEKATGKELKDRQDAVRYTIGKVGLGEAVTGGRKLEEVLRGDGVKVVRALRKWLGIRSEFVQVFHQDTLNADRFIEMFGPVMRYNVDRERWMHYDGRRWVVTNKDTEKQMANRVSASWKEEADSCADEGKRKALRTLARSATSAAGARNAFWVATRDLTITSAMLDANRWLLNCLNGTLDLRTLELRPHDSKDLCTKMAPVEYVRNAQHGVWNRFIQEGVPDRPGREFLQRFMGYCLTGSVDEDTFVFIHGPGGGGKSTFVLAMQRVLGDYVVELDSEELMRHQLGGRGPNESIARLAGARLATSVESKSGKQLDENLVKKLTGGDVMSAEYKFGHRFEFHPSAKLILASNHEPRVPASDSAFWRRPCKVSFPKERSQEGERDATIKRTLSMDGSAAEAVLAWMVEGLREYLRKGKLEIPASVRADTERWRADQIPLTEFFASRCTLKKTGQAMSLQLYRCYRDWCEQEAGERHPLSDKDFKLALQDSGLRPKRTKWGVEWEGIAMAPQFKHLYEKEKAIDF